VPPPRTPDAPEARESAETTATAPADGQAEQDEAPTTLASPVPLAADKPSARGRPPVVDTPSVVDKTRRPETPVVAEKPVPVATRAAAPAVPATPASAGVGFQPAEKLAEVRSGDSKERIFDLFATVFVKQNGKVEQIDGIRLRVSSRPTPNRLVEVGEVLVAERDASGTPYWFLFEEGLLLAWGKPEQWDAAALRYQIELDYAPRRTAEARSRS
jgi:hypothetical protein